MAGSATETVAAEESAKTSQAADSPNPLAEIESGVGAEGEGPSEQVSAEAATMEVRSSEATAVTETGSLATPDDKNNLPSVATETPAVPEAPPKKKRGRQSAAAKAAAAAAAAAAAPPRKPEKVSYVCLNSCLQSKIPSSSSWMTD